MERFQEFLAWTKARSYKIQRFRCDNGTGEYRNQQFYDILKAEGIQFEPAPPYTQHKNGVAERMIRTLNTKIRSLLLDGKVPTSFWPDALNAAIHLHRRSPTNSLGPISTYEALNGIKPKIKHLRRFGCTAYWLIPKERITGNFEERSKPCMFIGYTHSTHNIPGCRKTFRIVAWYAATSAILRKVVVSALPSMGTSSIYASRTEDG
jgi:hypothetical protein